MTDYQLCGWRVRSEVPLPELLHWRAGDRDLDLVIRLGAVPERLAEPVYEAPLFQLGGNGCCRFEIVSVAAYLIDAEGRSVVVAPSHGSDAQESGVFLLSSVLAILCHRRGLLPLHASSVLIDGKAVAFVGASGLGKSVLAALFYKQGYTVLADDLAVVDVSAQEGPMILPSSPQLALWRDDLERLGYGSEGLVRRRAGLEKYNLPLVNQISGTAPVPLAAIYHLGEANDPRHVMHESIRGLNAVMTVNENMHAGLAGRRLSGDKALFKRAAHLAAAVPVYQLTRPLSMEHNAKLVTELAERYALCKVSLT